MSGFGNEFASEALAGALPRGRNSPQRCPYGLYAEQFSGTAFTAPRAANRRSWLYRIRPAVMHHAFERLDHALLDEPREEAVDAESAALGSVPIPAAPTDFIEGLVPIAGNGSPAAHSGCGIYLYATNRSMQRRFFYDADGELLMVPQQGAAAARHRARAFGTVSPRRSQSFRAVCAFAPSCRTVLRAATCARISGLPFKLPDLGPIGSNGLANANVIFRRRSPATRNRDGECELVGKFLAAAVGASMDHSPFDVVAWQGNYAPYKYDLRRFNAMGSVCYDHPDPSISLVLQRRSRYRAPGTSTSSIFRHAGWRRRTPSGRPGFIAMSPVNSWASSAAPMTQRAAGSCRAAHRCTIA